MWVAEITDRDTYKRHRLGSFYTVELTALEYVWWHDRLHGVTAHLNFPFGTAPIELVPPPPGVVRVAVASEVRESIVSGGRRRGVHGRPPPPIL